MTRTNGIRAGGARTHRFIGNAGRPLAAALAAALAAPVAAEPAIPANPAAGLPIRDASRFGDPCELGRALQEAERALGGIGMTEEERLAAVAAIGHDQRYYLYVKSWLQVEQFALAATRDAHERSGLSTADLDAQLAFFRKAIRILDLE